MIFQENVSLKKYSNFQIGGPARYFCEPQTEAELLGALAQAQKMNESIFILGGGCNLLINDAGFAGVVIKPSLKKIEERGDGLVCVGAGVLVSDFLEFCLERELSGWEWAGGLPGTVGGAIWGDAGAFGGETKDKVVQVASIQVVDGEKIVRTGKECEFGYRTSIFKTKAKDEIIIEAVFQLQKGSKVTMHQAIEQRKQSRREKHPLEHPNIGSIFKNIPVEKVPPEVLKQYESKIKLDPFPVLPTAILSSAAGLKGYQVGGARVSEKHPNFIVNVGGATSADVLVVMRHIQATVREKFGVELEQEVIFVGF